MLWQYRCRSGYADISEKRKATMIFSREQMSARSLMCGNIVRGSPAAHTLETLRQIGRASGAGGQSAACLCGGIFAGHAATDGRKRPAYEAQQEAYAETFLTIAADLVYSMMDAGCPHYVAWQEETEIKRLRVEDEESVYLFLMQFMECQKETAGSLRQRYEQQYRCEHPVHRLELTPELFLVLDGQTLADFGGDNWRQKLEEMELVL